MSQHNLLLINLSIETKLMKVKMDRYLLEQTIQNSVKFKILKYHDYKVKYSSWKELQKMGFLARNKDSNMWNKEDERILKETVVQITREELDIHVHDVAYYISHYIFHDRITKKMVERKIHRLLHYRLKKKPE